MSKKIDPYKKMWELLKPAIVEKMTALASHLKDEVPYAVSGPYLGGPDEALLSDEYRATVILKNEHDITVLAAEFKLLDGEYVGDTKGFAVSCDLSGYSGLMLGGYSPANYSDEFFTLDEDVLQSRVDEFDVGECSHSIITDALQDETLLREIADDSVGMSPA